MSASDFVARILSPLVFKCHEVSCIVDVMAQTQPCQYTSILNMTKHDDIASRMIERRAQLGWSQEQLSKESGVAAAQISRYEARINKPRANVIAKLAKALLVPFAWLANGETSEFDIAAAPKGFLDFVVQMPEDLALRIKEAAAKMGVSEEQFIIDALDSAYDSDKKK